MQPRLVLLTVVLLIWAALGGINYQFVANSRYVSLYGTSETPASTAQMRLMLDQGIDLIQMETGIYIEGGPEVFLVPNAQSYQRLSLGRDRIVEFSDAFYSSIEERVYIRSRAELGNDFVKTLIHEYTHWYLEQIFEGSTLWFHEGMAMLFARQLNMESYLWFVQQRFFGQASDLFQMSYEYPTTSTQWQIYYLTSYFAVSYLKDKKPEGWKRFWTLAAANYKANIRSSFIRSFNTAFGTSLLDFNYEFRDYSKKLSWQYLILGLNSLIFALLPFILIFVYLKRKKKMQKLPDLDYADAE